MKIIYSYRDYRSYLRDYYKTRKAELGGYTYQRFAKAAGIKSSNYLKLVIDGTRNLSIDNIHQFSNALNHSFDETQYFEAMVHFCQTEGRQKSYYRARMQEIRRRSPSSATKSSAEDLISSWYLPAIIVSLDGADEEQAVTVVSQKTGIARERAIQVIELLEKKKFFDIAQGKYRLADQYFVFHDLRSTSSTHKRYVSEQLELSKKVLEKRYDRGAKFFTHTFTLAEKNFDLYVEKTRAFLQQLTALSNEDPAERVAQLNIQFFTLRDQPWDQHTDNKIGG